ncbi:heterokaryon incompatibility protein-domain-containing protein [Trametes elegans]|nr:heterokaryon incompatibility protein-domain-containing protein [Trametes elegans]
MYLLNTGSARLEHFPNPDTRPPYAILSHVWQGHEASFQDIDALRAHANPLAFAPAKVQRFCQFARAEDFEWAWLDTCCINKTSSAELSEALNSMFSWYQDAIVCYAYLHDVADRAPLDTVSRQDGSELDVCLVESEWFTRGWTLQELLAPRFLFFLSRDWTLLGTRDSFASEVEGRIGIDYDVLTHSRPLHKVSIARRMSWASRRRTTRPEDRAYSLMGLFGVHMTAIYGEGEQKAFYRLQEEILHCCAPDQSIFAWGYFNLYDALSLRSFKGDPSDVYAVHKDASIARGSQYLLAPSPDCFADARDVVPIPHTCMREALGTYESSDIGLTGFGVRVSLPLVPLGGHPNITVLAVMACQDERLPSSALCLYLSPRSSIHTSQLYSVGAFTPKLPTHVCSSLRAAASEVQDPRRLFFSRGAFLSLDTIGRDVRRTVITPTIYVLRDTHRPVESLSAPRRHPNAFRRLSERYAAASGLSTTSTYDNGSIPNRGAITSADTAAEIMPMLLSESSTQRSSEEQHAVRHVAVALSAKELRLQWSVTQGREFLQSLQRIILSLPGSSTQPVQNTIPRLADWPENIPPSIDCHNLLTCSDSINWESQPPTPLFRRIVPDRYAHTVCTICCS